MAISYGGEPYPTWKILDAINMGEFDALDDKDRNRIAMIIGAGHINFKQHSPMWDLIKNIFGNESNSWKAIKAMAKHEYDETAP